MIKVIYADCHFGAAHSLDECLDTIFKENPETTLLLGDICDIKNTLKRDKNVIDSLYNHLRRVYKEKYCRGNHCIFDFNRFYKEAGVLFIHSDEVLWSKKKYKRWFMKKPYSASKWKRPFLKLFNNYRKKHGPTKLNVEQKHALATKALKEGCHSIVLGHLHPERRIDTYFMGVKITVLPRGRNIL